jgi:two-component system sensor histidine kinase AlgZ
MVTGGALPATLLWLIAGLQPQEAAGAAAAGAADRRWRGAGRAGRPVWLRHAGLAGVSAEAPPWLASACTGALLAAGLLARRWCGACAGRTPAATTARLAELQSRIRPHFLFNTLNTAIALVREEPGQGRGGAGRSVRPVSPRAGRAGRSSTWGRRSSWRAATWQIEQVRFGERLQRGMGAGRARAAATCRR